MDSQMQLEEDDRKEVEEKAHRLADKLRGVYAGRLDAALVPKLA